MTSMTVCSDDLRAPVSQKSLVSSKPRGGFGKDPLAPRPISEGPLDTKPGEVATGPKMKSESTADRINASRGFVLKHVNAEFSSCESIKGCAVIKLIDGNIDGKDDVSISVPDDSFMTIRSLAYNNYLECLALHGSSDLASTISEFCAGKVIEGIAAFSTDIGGRTTLIITLHDGNALVVDSRKTLSLS